ncbi:lytic transglycosylase domain-containing protein [Phenylobacterium sp. Root700]|uniref:lytic transglycosylase domain-containing protein n=1 Tax=Phenylobacterium sp. Root700 TaxID=1736591 RepID=UPI000700C31F|nr:lytic transglycosylase domain-containing protein [Phenylobacterium sp. Root700]KRB42553.1 hypothetical protein ASE02_21775 [Phenylobacterium sp. Root700]
MILDLAAALSLAQACAPQVATETLLAIVQVESGFDTLAIGVNGGSRPGARPSSAHQAAREAERLLRAGANLDLGLGQINSRNLAWLDLSIEDAFDPCRNLAAAGRVLTLNYRRTSRDTGHGQTALSQALSLYNTGDQVRGQHNGYVAKVRAAARAMAPSLTQTLGAPSTANVPSHDVFSGAASLALVFITPDQRETSSLALPEGAGR